MKKIKLESISLAYKISIAAAFLLLLINILSVFFVLFPVYNLADDGEQLSTENDRKLERAEKTSNIIFGVSYVLAAVSLGSGAYGVYQDVRKKSKAKS